MRALIFSLLFLSNLFISYGQICDYSDLQDEKSDIESVVSNYTFLDESVSNQGHQHYISEKPYFAKHVNQRNLGVGKSSFSAPKKKVIDNDLSEIEKSIVSPPSEYFIFLITLSLVLIAVFIYNLKIR